MHRHSQSRTWTNHLFCFSFNGEYFCYNKFLKIYYLAIKCWCVLFLVGVISSITTNWQIDKRTDRHTVGQLNEFIFFLVAFASGWCKILIKQIFMQYFERCYGKLIIFWRYLWISSFHLTLTKEKQCLEFGLNNKVYSRTSQIDQRAP